MYYTSKKIINSKICFGFFIRNNGYSKNNYSSLNCSYASGDDKKLVTKNINFAQQQIRLEKKSLKIINQIHSKNIIFINKENLNEKFQADGMITQDKNISIAILTADCCPVFLFDKDASFISCLHVGWRGCYLNIIENAIIKIQNIQPQTKQINAIIGPCLNQKNFEVEKKFKNYFVEKSEYYKNFFYRTKKGNKYLFDMVGLIKFQLLEHQIMNIDNIDLDTYDNKDLFFSHRRSTHISQLPTGRMINIIGFNN